MNFPTNELLLLFKSWSVCGLSQVLSLVNSILLLETPELPLVKVESMLRVNVRVRASDKVDSLNSN